MDNKKPQSRPVYLNLLKIRQPVTALASIAHRISGVLLFLSLPATIWALDRSLQSPEGYREVALLCQQPLTKLLVVLLAWAISHHFFAGIRYLLIDVDWGVDLATAKRTALVVNVCGVAGVLVALMILL